MGLQMWKATTIISDGMAGKWKTMVRGWTTSIKFIRKSALDCHVSRSEPGMQGLQ